MHDGHGTTAEIPFEELADIDLDDIEAVADDGLYAHFSELASRATEGQLRAVLDLGPADDEVTREEMVHAYASRRAALAVRMRALREA